MKFNILLLTVSIASAMSEAVDFKVDELCPGPAIIGIPHAITRVQAEVTNRGCYNVHDEIYSRIHGESKWLDPNAGGTY